MSTSKEYINTLMQRSQVAQKEIEFASQERIDELCEAIAWETVQPAFVQEIAEMGVKESRMGDIPSKYAKMMNKVRGGWFDMKGQKSVGVIEENKAKGLIKIAKPVGIIGAMIPCTNCEATPVLKSMYALKARNAIILAPHPRTQGTNKFVVDKMRAVLKRLGAPEDLIINMDEVSMDNSQELMAQCDLILATGGGDLVKTAYSSGTPAYGVGAGNAVIIVDETQDMAIVADKIRKSKTFDQATSCSSENSCLIASSKYDAFVEAMKKEGGYLVSADEKKKLQNTMWVEGHLNKDIVAQKAITIAKLANIDIPETTQFLMVEETGVGADYPFSGEKLSVVTTLYKWDTFDQAVSLVNRITGFSGPGHSCGIHSDNKERILELSTNVKVSRVMVCQPQALANSGSWTNGMPMTLTLGCGTWGGNISSENITWRNLLNTTWVSSPIANFQPSDKDLFSTKVRKS